MIRQTIYNQAYGYQTFKQNLQEHTNTQSNQPSNWKLYFVTQRRKRIKYRLWLYHVYVHPGNYFTSHDIGLLEYVYYI